MPKAPAAERETSVQSAETVENRTANLPQNSVQRLGLPPLKGPRLKFAEFVQYWADIAADRRTHITVYVYVLLPLLNFPDREHSIDKIPGETPLGTEEEVLNRYGLGDFHFKMKYSAEGVDKIITASWLTGFSDNLPGFRDFTNHPPLYIRDPKYVVVDDEKNIKSGFIQWLRKTGQLPGGAPDENTKENDMADAQANAASTAILGDITKTLITDKLNKAPEAVPVPPTDHGTAMMREAFSTSLEIARQTNVDVPKLLETAAKLMQHDPPPLPPPVDFKPFTDQVASLTASVIGMHEKRADDMTKQLERQNDLMQRMLERERTPHVAPAPVHTERVDPVDSLIDQADKFSRLKTALGWTPPVVDDDPAPRRRRRPDDDEDEDADAKKGGGILESIFGNLPAILSAVTTIGGIVATSLHNAAVLKTGEGAAIAPPQGVLLPHQAPPFPGPTQAQFQPHMQMQQPNPQPQQQQQGDPQRMKAFDFLSQITPGLLGAFDRAETGYDYAELFIKTYGRSGEFGYEMIKLSGTLPPFGNPAQGFNPEGSAKVLAQLMSMYPPIWGRLGNDPRLEGFLIQFVSYDQFLKDADVPNLTKLCIEYEVDSVAEYLALPEDTDEGEGDGGDGAEGADVRAAEAASESIPAVVPTVVPGMHVRKPKPGAGAGVEATGRAVGLKPVN